MYGSIEGWRAYALDRGDSAPTNATNPDATAALVRGSDYIRMRYVANLLSAYDAETFTPPGHNLPLTEEAAYVAASLELATVNFFSTTFTPDQQKVLTGVGNIKWTPINNGSMTYGSMPVSTKIEALFEPYVLNRNEPDMFFAAVGNASE